MSEHTPGPWHADDDGCSVFAEGDESHRVCRMSSLTAEQDQADATLIAAAPDLLAALEAVAQAKYDGPGDPVWVEALAAIRKAKGVKVSA